MKAIGVGAMYCTQLPVDHEVDHEGGGGVKTEN